MTISERTGLFLSLVNSRNFVTEEWTCARYGKPIHRGGPLCYYYERHELYTNRTTFSSTLVRGHISGAWFCYMRQFPQNPLFRIFIADFSAPYIYMLDFLKFLDLPHWMYGARDIWLHDVFDLPKVNTHTHKYEPV